MNRVYNFSAGPSAMPLEVLERCAAEMTAYGSAGMSVMEMSHRSSSYQEIIDNTERLLRELMGIPENYKVLFLQGGASSQFAMIPLNLLKNSKKADIVITGAWAKKAYSEGKKYGTMNGKVRQISEDTVINQAAAAAAAAEDGAPRSGSYYRTRVALGSTDTLRNLPDNFRLIPGMEVEVEIKTGRRRIIEYVIYPLIKALDETAREP